jgi:hypothetical protein
VVEDEVKMKVKMECRRHKKSEVRKGKKVWGVLKKTSHELQAVESRLGR